MVINTRHHLIFVHVPKAGGTSIARVLSRLDGHREDLVARTKHETLPQLRTNLSQRWRESGQSQCPDITDFFCFGFVRNPWDRMASLYHYLREQKPRREIASVMCFSDFLLMASDGVTWISDLHSMRQQVDFFSFESGRLDADFVGHYEFLRDDFATVMSMVGTEAKLPHLNRSSNQDVDYRKNYNTQMVDIVEELFAKDVDSFGYSFESAQPLRRCSGRLRVEGGDGG